MRFYAKVLGGNLDLLTFGKTPMAAQMPTDMHEKIASSRLSVDGNVILYGSDTPPHVPYQGIHGMSVSLAYDTAEQAERVFGALAEGGKVGMPLTQTFWAKRFGMLTDKFGCPWLINGELVSTCEKPVAFPRVGVSMNGCSCAFPHPGAHDVSLGVTTSISDSHTGSQQSSEPPTSALLSYVPRNFAKASGKRRDKGTVTPPSSIL